MRMNDQTNELANRIAEAAKETAIWRDGQHAFRVEGLGASNPYAADQAQATIWQNGFQSAQEASEGRTPAWVR